MDSESVSMGQHHGAVQDRAIRQVLREQRHRRGGRYPPQRADVHGGRLQLFQMPLPGPIDRVHDRPRDLDGPARDPLRAPVQDRL